MWEYYMTWTLIELSFYRQTVQDLERLNSEEGKIRRERSELERNVALIQHDLKDVTIVYMTMGAQWSINTID